MDGIADISIGQSPTLLFLGVWGLVFALFLGPLHWRYGLCVLLIHLWLCYLYLQHSLLMDLHLSMKIVNIIYYIMLHLFLLFLQCYYRLCVFFSFWVYCIEDMDNNSYHRSTLPLSYFWVWDGRSGVWRRRPMHENSFEGDEELGDDCAILKKMQTIIKIWASPFPYKIRGI